jgi:hypothetical protein
MRVEALRSLVASTSFTDLLELSDGGIDYILWSSEDGVSSSGVDCQCGLSSSAPLSAPKKVSRRSVA